MIVFYHANCADGFAAAWVARKKYPACECVPVHYGGTIPGVTGLDVMIVDFCFPEEVMVNLKQAANSLIVIDHHESNKNVAAKYGVFNNDKSGCVLTWEYLFPDMPIPELLLYIQDRDLWRWELPFSRELSAGLASYPKDFAIWDLLHFETLVSEGDTLLRYQRTVVDRHVKNAVLRNIAGREVPCVNATVLISEIGEALCNGYPFSATYFDRQDGKRSWSLRSAPDGIDVGALAKSLGGGGHRHAAGFETIIPDLEK